MKHSPADIVRSYLVDAGLGLLPGNEPWPMHLPPMPDSPDNAVLFKNTAGLYDGRYMQTGEVITHPGVQVLVRSIDEPTAYQKAFQIARILDAVCRNYVTVETSTYFIQSLSRRGDIIPLTNNKDIRETERLRSLYSINYITTIASDKPAILLPASSTDLVLGTFLKTQLPIGLVNGINSIFTITALPGTTETYMLFVNGVLKKRTVDYTLSGTTITFVSGRQPSTGALVLAYIDQG